MSPDTVDSPLVVGLKRDVAWLQKTGAEYEALQKSCGWTEQYFVEAGERPDHTKIISLDKSHGAMIRFSSEKDEDYRKIENCLVELIRDTRKTNQGAGATVT